MYLGAIVSVLLIWFVNFLILSILILEILKKEIPKYSSFFTLALSIIIYFSYCSYNNRLFPFEKNVYECEMIGNQHFPENYKSSPTNIKILFPKKLTVEFDYFLEGRFINSGEVLSNRDFSYSGKGSPNYDFSLSTNNININFFMHYAGKWKEVEPEGSYRYEVKDKSKRFLKITYMMFNYLNDWDAVYYCKVKS
jgi:hypothetical protein